MIITIFDTETTGFPKAGKPLAEQPHLLQLAAVSYVQDAQAGLRAVGHFSMLVAGDPIPEIPKAASDVHGIRAPLLERAGGPPSTALWHFAAMCERSDRIFAFNAGFDAQIISIAAERAEMPGLAVQLSEDKLFCLMLSAAPIVRVPLGRTGRKAECGPSIDGACKSDRISRPDSIRQKHAAALTPRTNECAANQLPLRAAKGWPKLSEAYQHFTRKELRGAHDAMVDVRAAAAVYSGLLKVNAEFLNPKMGAS